MQLNSRLKLPLEIQTKLENKPMTYKSKNVSSQPLKKITPNGNSVPDTGERDSNKPAVDTSSLDIFPNLRMLPNDNKVHDIGIPTHFLYNQRPPTIAEQVRDMY